MRVLIEWARRLMGTFRPSRCDDDLAEELRSHLQLAADEHDRRGGSAAESGRAARVQAGGVMQALDALRDQRSLPTLDALAADLVFGWRQIVRHRTVSRSAILSLGLAMGATLAAFRLVDALLLRPLPVADPSRLFAITTTTLGVDGGFEEHDNFDYPTFRRFRSATADRADLLLIGMAARPTIRIDPPASEPAVQQFVSGNVFSALGLQPALGRLLGPADDVTPGGHPVVVISHDFWRGRFAGDVGVIGRTVLVGERRFEIVGVAPEGFTGTEPGALTDFFIPAAMNPQALESPGWSWFRIWLKPSPGVSVDEVRALLQTQFKVDLLARGKKLPSDTPQSRIDALLTQQLDLQSAGAGVSATQKAFRRPLWILAALAALLLLIACGNVANLLLARAVSRRTEMSLRVSIGAGRGRLLQLLLIESALLALFSCLAGVLFATWAAPVVVAMLGSADQPIRLVLPIDRRMLAVACVLTTGVTVLFGLAPALRASAVRPVGALRERDPSQRRLSASLLCAQMALCVFLLLGASLFLGTFKRLLDKPLGFAPEDLIHLTVAGRTEFGSSKWQQLAASLRETPGVESVALAGWAPLTGNRWRSSITIDGRSSEPSAPNWVNVSPGYFATMKTPVIEGREFRWDDRPPGAGSRTASGVAIVNHAFARTYFGGQSPIGRQVIVDSSGAAMQIVGMVADAVYFNVREPMHPAVFVPLATRDGATVLVRTAAPAPDLPALLRRNLSGLDSRLVVGDVVPFEAIVTRQMIRERLLAVLSAFFAGLALVLAGIGLYGLMNYSVSRERRQIGLRMALGATPRHVASLIVARLMAAVCIGAAVGVAGGLALSGMVRTVLFEVTPTSPAVWLTPLVTLGAIALLAAVAPVLHAIRIDPAETLRVEG
jgi:putative ABC transport system permease protein